MHKVTDPIFDLLINPSFTTEERLSIVKQYLTRHPDSIEAKTVRADGNSVLNFICEHYDYCPTELLDIIFEAGADPNESIYRVELNSSPLGTLCFYDKPTEFVEYLIANGADANCDALSYCSGRPYEDNFVTEFIYATSTAKVLIENGAIATSSDLYYAIKQKAPEALINLLLEQPIEVDAEDLIGYCRYASPSIKTAQLFLNRMTSDNNQDYLLLAVCLLCYQAHSYEVIKYCLSLNSNPSFWNQKATFYDYEGTPLHHACVNRRTDLYQLFLEIGCDPTIQDNGIHYHSGDWSDFGVGDHDDSGGHIRNRLILAGKLVWTQWTETEEVNKRKNRCKYCYTIHFLNDKEYDYYEIKSEQIVHPNQNESELVDIAQKLTIELENKYGIQSAFDQMSNYLKKGPYRTEGIQFISSLKEKA